MWNPKLPAVTPESYWYCILIVITPETHTSSLQISRGKNGVYTIHEDYFGGNLHCYGTTLNTNRDGP